MDRKIPISISLPESMLRTVDESRGNVPRSKYILAILSKNVGTSKVRSKSGRERGELKW